MIHSQIKRETFTFHIYKTNASSIEIFNYLPVANLPPRWNSLNQITRDGLSDSQFHDDFEEQDKPQRGDLRTQEII